MNKNNRFVRIGIAVVLASLMAGASARTLLTAMEIPCGAAGVYLPALIAAALCGLGSCSGAATVVSYVLAALAGGAVVATNLDALGAVRNWFMSRMNSGTVMDAASLAQAGLMMSVLIAALLSACLYAAVSRPGTTPLALLIYFVALVGSYALAESMSFALTIPGLVAALAAFALSGEVARDTGAWRTLIPASLIVALALLLVPSDRLTWEPLENAANTVRNVFEDYFRFTHERVPFTISTEGYNHAAEIDGTITTQLGGPAMPSEEEVMKITSDKNVLLRGSIRRTYTGHSWEDADAKARYLFYDFTRGHVRDRVFGMHDNEVFEPVSVSVEFIRTGTSSLFVPARLEEFSMDLQNALYYNSVGEMFLSRQVEEGDEYSLTGYVNGDEAALRRAVIDAQEDKDDDYAEILESCNQLPEGIEEGVYTLAIELTRDAENDYDKAAAILSWLRENCAYTLEPEYPDYERDFVSQFIMDGREGYCSYFASAMTVMCRIAGLPARYVEGYSVKAGEEVIITGEDAHAWTEVYFNGIGWVPFDASTGAAGNNDDPSDDESDNHDPDEPESTPEPTPTPTPTPSPSPTPETEDATPPPEDQNDPESTPTPEPESTPTPEPDGATVPPLPSDPPENPEDDKNFDWLWMLLIILLILILLLIAAMLVYSRLKKTDPILLSSKARTGQEAAMILYRSILTLLAQTGQVPMSGETPGMFARRVTAQVKNPEFIAFADAVAMSAYARAGVGKPVVDAGRRAYQTFEKNMKRSEKIKFIITRLLKGLGEFESIP